MEDQLRKLVEYLGEQGGVLVLHKLHESTNKDTPWMVSFEFGSEAEDSDMVGGAAYGAGATAEDAVKQVFEQCGLGRRAAPVVTTQGRPDDAAD